MDSNKTPGWFSELRGLNCITKFGENLGHSSLLVRNEGGSNATGIENRVKISQLFNPVKFMGGMGEIS